VREPFDLLNGSCMQSHKQYLYQMTFFEIFYLVTIYYDVNNYLVGKMKLIGTNG